MNKFDILHSLFLNDDKPIMIKHQQNSDENQDSLATQGKSNQFNITSLYSSKKICVKKSIMFIFQLLNINVWYKKKDDCSTKEIHVYPW